MLLCMLPMISSFIWRDKVLLTAKVRGMMSILKMRQMPDMPEGQQMPDMPVGEPPERNGQQPPEMPDGMMERPDDLLQGETEGELSEIFAIMAGGNYFIIR